MPNRIGTFFAVLGVAVATVTAAAVDLPHTFTAETTISSSEVNENFTALNEGKQERVSEDCEVGSTIRAINEDGTVECDAVQAFHAEPDDDVDDISSSPSYTTVVDTSVPAGSYVINAKAVVADAEGADPFLATVRCTIFSGDDLIDSYAVTLGPPDEGATVLALQGVTITEGSATSLRLACRKGGNDTTQVRVGGDPMLTAIRVGSIE